MKTLVLASSSPRRKEMLAALGYRFRVIVPEVVEKVRNGESPTDFALRTAGEKAAAAQAIWQREGGGPAVIVAADTVVSKGRKLYGKPVNPGRAAAMLRALSGRGHKVTTAVSLRDTATGRERNEAITTRVLFRTLDAEEIACYVATGEPMDKAGAYGIQGAAAFMVRSIEGSYTNVVGLPLCEVTEWLADWGISPAPPPDAV